MAGGPGFEPRLTESEFHDRPGQQPTATVALVLDGEALLGAGRRTAKAGAVAWAAVSASGDGFDTLPIAAGAASARVLVFASPVIDEPVAMGGPFVMDTREEILEAFADLRAGRLIVG